MNKICHPLQGVCILLNLVADHLDRKSFISEVLTNEIPADTRIVYKSAVADKTREDALPIVAYKSLGSKFIPFNPQHNLGVKGGTALQLAHNLAFTVSTTSEGLTGELSFEIGGLIASLTKDLRNIDVFTNSIDISEIQRDDAKYFIQTVSVSLILGYPVWKTDKFRSTLREVNI